MSTSLLCHDGKSLSTSQLCSKLNKQTSKTSQCEITNTDVYSAADLIVTWLWVFDMSSPSSIKIPKGHSITPRLVAPPYPKSHLHPALRVHHSLVHPLDVLLLNPQDGHGILPWIHPQHAAHSKPIAICTSPSRTMKIMSLTTYTIIKWLETTWREEWPWVIMNGIMVCSLQPLLNDSLSQPHAC